MLNDLSRTASRMSSGDRGSSYVQDEIFDTSTGFLPKQEKDPNKLKDFYREFGDAINANKVKKSQAGHQDVNLHDILRDLHFIGKNTFKNLQIQQDQGTEFTAISSDVVQQQSFKFRIQINTEIHYYNEQSKEDSLKNLFKLLCGIMNLGLKQRGKNPMNDEFLK